MSWKDCVVLGRGSLEVDTAQGGQVPHTIRPVLKPGLRATHKKWLGMPLTFSLMVETAATQWSQPSLQLSTDPEVRRADQTSNSSASSGVFEPHPTNLNLTFAITNAQPQKPLTLAYRSRAS